MQSILDLQMFTGMDLGCTDSDVSCDSKVSCQSNISSGPKPPDTTF